MKRRYILLLSALVLFTGTVIMTGCPSQVKPQTPKYKVTLNSGKHGSVTVKPSLPADGMVEAHTRLSFTAQPDEGYEVDTWTGANRNYPDNTTATLNVITDTTVSVTFKRIGYSSEKQKYKVTLIQPEHGTVTVKPALSEDGMIPQHTRLTFTVTPEPGWQVNKWTGAKIWQNQIGCNEIHLVVTEDLTVSVTMIEEGKADALLLIIDSTGRLTGVTDKYRLKGSLALPNTVTAIGSEALSQCTGLTSVIIPDSVTSIGYKAFYGCTGLTGVTIGNNVTEIDGCAFFGCHNLISITVPDSVAEIGGGAFHDCKSLTSVTIGKGVTKIASSAFDGCNKIKTLNINCKTVPYLGMTSLKELTLGDNVNAIGERAFYSCTDLTNITIPGSVTKIGNEAFQGCTGLTDVIIPDSVVEIGKSAFKDCSNIISLAIGKGLTTIIYDEDYYSNKSPFDGCNKIEKLNINCKTVPKLNIKSLKEVIIGEQVTEISDGAFSYCEGLTAITIPRNVTKIGERAFENCTGLTSIVLPESIAEIGERTFNNCTHLTSLTIPNSVTKIESEAFKGCIGLTDVTIPDKVIEINAGAFSGCTGLTSITIPDSVTTIGSDSSSFFGGGAFENCDSLTSVTIGKGVIKIASSTFSGCNKIKTLNINCKTVPYLGMKNLKELTLGDNVNAIGEQAFDGYTDLTNVTIPNSVTKIGNEAFQGCTGLTDVTIGAGVTEIGREAFRGCTGLTAVIIPDSVTEIGKSAFKNCSNITSLTIGKGLTTIHLGDTDYSGDNQKTPFNGCNQIEKLDINCSITPRLDITSLKDIIIGDNVSIIGKDSFSNCTGLTNITIGNNVTTISDNAFSGCTGLTTLTIPDSVTKIGERAFNNCSGLITITIGKGLENYHYSSFDGCNNVKTLNINCRGVKDVGFKSLTELNMGNNVINIWVYTFQNCSLLTSVTIPESVAFIGAYAFAGCSNLTTAIFKSNASWKLESYGGHINIQEELENPSKAAQYLRSSASHCSWTKN